MARDRPGQAFTPPAAGAPPAAAGGVGTGALSWAVGAYMLAVAAVVVPGGRLGDMLGQRVTVVTGGLAFAAGAVVVAASGSEAVLLADRVLQGVGAAALMPSTMAVLRLRASGIINVVR
ncbi:MFS transporter [Streptomyces xanthophaeus]|uniref:MFS transporter n=1 Tax=Streptomyces xanthophaeus TaxID=67385 RepID=UPI0004CD7CC3|nr:MFS transporter [Streptomyces xanthophaeus]